jgi:hypothetical protein
VRTASLLAGLALALYAVPQFAIAAGPPPLPLTVDASIVRSGEVGVPDGGLLLTGSQIRPSRGESATGRLELISETSKPVDVTVQDIGLPSGLEDQIWLRVTLNGVVVFQGPQTRLRQTPSRSFRLLPGAEVPIEITVALPGHSTESAGRHTELRVRVVSPVAGA